MEKVHHCINNCCEPVFCDECDGSACAFCDEPVCIDCLGDHAANCAAEHNIDPNNLQTDAQRDAYASIAESMLECYEDDDGLYGVYEY